MDKQTSKQVSLKLRIYQDNKKAIRKLYKAQMILQEVTLMGKSLSEEDRKWIYTRILNYANQAKIAHETNILKLNTKYATK